ncbi:MFS transporter [Nonomuraea sediminis]|uniref:MFS transporter n=1 Tax=Nonomuraea sediminis TaxID=2835864 RepID=UPI001BDC962D|nr:MFS transporter [Nonomuraea sediminis]
MYRDLLRRPGVAGQAVLGFAAQLTQQVAPVGIVLVVQESTRSLAMAGGCAAAMSIGTGLARPVQGRVIDRRGARSVLVVTALAHVGALAALVACADVRAPSWALVVLALVAGANLPPISVSMRLEWGRLGEGRTAAYSLVYLVQQLAILAGPLVFGMAIALASASVALGLVAVAAGLGTLAFSALSSRSAPGAREERGRVFAHRGMWILLAVMLLLGGTIGALEVGLPALAAARGMPAATGLLVAALSLGGIAGAALYGMREWTVAPRTRLVVLMLAMGVATLPLVALPWLPAFWAMLFLAGIALNPALTTTSLLVDELAPAAQAEAFGWVSTAAGAGVAAGSGVAGVVGQQFGTMAPFLVGALFALAGAALATRRVVP